MPLSKLYLPKDADNYGPTLAHVKREVAEAFGGYTTYDGTGGWVGPDGETVEEPVTVIETVHPMTADMGAVYGTYVDLARHVKEITTESVVTAYVNGETIMVGE